LKPISSTIKLFNKLINRAFGIELRRSNLSRVAPYHLNWYYGSRFANFHNLMSQIKYVEGDVVECGVGKGSTLFSMSLLSILLEQNRTFYGFDSFQGLPEPTQEDKPESDPDKIFKGRFTWSKQETIDSMLLNGLPEEFLENKIHLIEGWFENTFQEYKGNGVALLHIDVDNYMPYKESLEHFYPLVNKGGAITFDEYNDPVWAGATKAVDEFFSDKPEQVIKSKFYRCYVIKE